MKQATANKSQELLNYIKKYYLYFSNKNKYKYYFWLSLLLPIIAYVFIELTMQMNFWEKNYAIFEGIQELKSNSEIIYYPEHKNALLSGKKIKNISCFIDIFGVISLIFMAMFLFQNRKNYKSNLLIVKSNKILDKYPLLTLLILDGCLVVIILIICESYFTYKLVYSWDFLGHTISIIFLNILLFLLIFKIK